MSESKRTKIEQTQTETQAETVTETAPQGPRKIVHTETIHQLKSNHITDCMYAEMREGPDREIHGYVVMHIPDVETRDKLIQDIFTMYRTRFYGETNYEPIIRVGNAELVHTVEAGDAWFVDGEYCLPNTEMCHADTFARDFGLVEEEDDEEEDE